ncbi:MAG: tRNA (guanosine(37)-N1)-methyltransferase TrmD [Candidatus Margulisiibacteriota bacterium]
MLKKAQEKGLLRLNLVNLRDFTSDKHKTADDTPYGGGAGMVMKVDVVVNCLAALGTKFDSRNSIAEHRIILMSPRGEKLTQKKVRALAKEKQLVIICGHYEGVDERVCDYIDEEISIGDYVLTGGELPAMVLVDAVARHIPGVVKEAASVENDSFSGGRLDYPCYTRPEEFEGKKVPEILLSGNHKEIARWRAEQALRITRERRPDLLG